MKKQRGLRRYYKNLAIEIDFSETTFLDLPQMFEGGFERRHWHFDRKGYGNHSFKRRKPHLDKLFRHFDILAERTKYLQHNIQVFAILLDHDSSSDALFLHAPDPNESAFPIDLENLSENCTLKNQNLAEYVNRRDAYEKLYGVADEPFCILFVKDQDVSTRPK